MKISQWTFLSCTSHGFRQGETFQQQRLANIRKFGYRFLEVSQKLFQTSSLDYPRHYTDLSGYNFWSLLTPASTDLHEN